MYNYTPTKIFKCLQLVFKHNNQKQILQTYTALFLAGYLENTQKTTVYVCLFTHIHLLNNNLYKY